MMDKYLKDSNTEIRNQDMEGIFSKMEVIMKDLIMMIERMERESLWIIVARFLRKGNGKKVNFNLDISIKYISKV